jgi:hypothetical protein
MIAWHTAVLCGATALTHFFGTSALVEAAAATTREPASQPEQQQQQQQWCPVQAALLFTAIEGLYFGVRQDLIVGNFDSRPGCNCCPTCVNQTSNAAVKARQSELVVRTVKADITTRASVWPAAAFWNHRCEIAE